MRRYPSIILLIALTAFCPWASAAEAVFESAREFAGRHAGVAIDFPDVSLDPGSSQQLHGVPIPYPNVGRSHDTDRGPARPLYNRSYFERPPAPQPEPGGRECDTPPRTNHSGRTYFEMHDIDVEFEESPAVRFMDLTTQNHG